MTELTSRLTTALGDRYRIERHLGEGGMAHVYLAQDLKHERQVAIKVLRPELAAVLGAERFVQEIKTTATLQHPNILPQLPEQHHAPQIRRQSRRPPIHLRPPRGNRHGRRGDQDGHAGAALAERADVPKPGRPLSELTGRLKAAWHITCALLILMVAACGESAGPERTPLEVANIVVTAPSTSIGTLHRSMQLTAEGRDPANRTVPGVQFTWRSSDPSIMSVDETGTVTAQANGPATISAVAATVTPGVEGSVGLTVLQVAASLVFEATPAAVRPGVPISSVRVDAVDSLGSLVPSADTTVTVSLGTNPRSATLGGTTASRTAQGVASFTDLHIDKAALGYTLTATANGLSTATSKPLDVFDPYRQLSTSAVACAVTVDSLAFCWGLNESGQVGNGSTVSPVDHPAAVVTLLKFTEVAAGFFHACGLTPTGAAYCWGSNSRGQLGDANGGTGSTVPVEVAGNHVFRSLAAGVWDTCGVTTSDEAYCWGSLMNSDVPVLVSGGHAFATIGLYSTQACGVTTTGDAYCWFNGSAVPMLVAGGLAFAAVHPGVTHTCGVTPGKVAYCWGSDMDGRLGDGGTDMDSSLPVMVAGGITFMDVWAGSEHSCGLASDGRAFCWGAAHNGAVGNGQGGSGVGSPTLVVGGFRYASITAGGGSCAIRTDGAAFCWGGDFEGQLGNGLPLSSESTPQLVIEP